MNEKLPGLVGPPGISPWHLWSHRHGPVRGIPARTFEPGEVIVRQDTSGSGEAYLVHEGRVEARRQVGGEDRLLRILTPGALLGEVSLFQEAPHSATTVAADRVTLLVIPTARLESMVRAHPKLAIALIRELARMAGGADADSKTNDA